MTSFKAITLVFFILPLGLLDDIPDEAVDDPGSSRRGEFMRKAVERFQVVFPDEPDMEVVPHKQLILRWSNPTTKVKDGGVGVFCHNGRPLLFVELQLHRAELMINEFARLTPAPIEVTMKYNKQLIWKPASDVSWSDFQELPDLPPPFEEKRRRLTQMRRIAERFSVIDHFGSRKEKMQKIALRLMTSPVYRFGTDPRGVDDKNRKTSAKEASPSDLADTAAENKTEPEESEVIDGAVFIFAQGTNPEAMLTIEAWKRGSKTGWRYCLTPSTVYELEASFDGNVVWSKPRYQNFCQTYGPYFACPYRRHPEDDRLKGAFSNGKAK